jgi:regulator of RNase E activity RraA
MAKFRYKTPQHSTGTVVTTKTHFGSHANMVIAISGVMIGENEVICKDDNGYYVTEKTKLDNGLADPNRYTLSKRISLFVDTTE